jgi:lipid II:glycine glycyltransferase (peptidoglycan interpeptide bridge formation enzyme)
VPDPRRYATTARQQIRQAARSGVVVRPRTDRQAIDDFFGLHLETRRHRHGLLAQPRALFELLWERYVLAGDGAVVMAELDGVPVAGGVVLDHGDVSYFKFAAASAAGREIGASYACLFGSLRYANERGSRQLDLGRSESSQPGLVAFKRRFRPEERTLVRHRRGEPPLAGQDASATLGELTRLLVDPRVPDDIVETAGRLLYRYFA